MLLAKGLGIVELANGLLFVVEWNSGSQPLPSTELVRMVGTADALGCKVDEKSFALFFPLLSSRSVNFGTKKMRIVMIVSTAYIKLWACASVTSLTASVRK